MSDQTSSPPPQLSPDGRWWWNGYQWVPLPAPPVAPVKRRGPGALSWVALGFGVFAVYAATMGMIGIADMRQGGYQPGLADVLLAFALTGPGLVIGTVAVIWTGRGTDKVARRWVASSGMALSLFCFAFMCLILLV